MAKLKFSPKPHVEVLLRVFDLSRRGMSTALAEGILALDFPEEEAELEAYSNINDLLAYRQSKARRKLQQSA